MTIRIDCWQKADGILFVSPPHGVAAGSDAAG